MHAVVLPSYGPASALTLRDIPEPAVVGTFDVKVRVVAAGINPIDWKLRGGAYHSFVSLDFPAVLGRDVSGTVVEVGAGVASPRVGARVMGFVHHGYAEVVVALSDAWAEVPYNLDLVDAAALPLALLSGAQLIEEAAEVRPGEKVLITGATGSVGRVAVFVAKARGAIVYAGVRRSYVGAATRLGAQGVVALDDDRQIELLPSMNVLADTVGGPTTQKLLSKLKAGGRVATIVGEPPGAKERGLSVRSFLARADARRLAQLGAEVAAGRLDVPIAMRLPLAEAAQAHQLAEMGAGGKILLTL